MVACKTVGEYKRNQEKIRKFCLEEKAALAKQQEAKAKRTRATPQSAPIPQNQPGPSQSVINTQPLGPSELVAMAKRNQQAHKRQRAAKKTISKPSHRQVRPQPMTHKSPGSPKRPQWIKNAKGRLTKPSRAYLIRNLKPPHCNIQKNQNCRTSVSLNTPAHPTARALRRSTRQNSNLINHHVCTLPPYRNAPRE